MNNISKLKGEHMSQIINEDKINYFYKDLLCENSTSALILCDKTETIIYCNQTFLDMFSFISIDDVLGKTLSILHASGDSYRSFLKKLHHASKVRKPLKFEWELIKNGRSPVQCEIDVKTLEKDKNVAGFFVLTINNVTHWKKLETEISYKTTHDLLTGFPNRVLFNDRLSLALIQAHRNKERLAVMFFDLDSFKKVNYKYGYSIGDQLLKETGTIIKRCLRKGDSIGRFGGDEYLILLPGVIKKENVALVAEKILQPFRHPIHINGHELLITASIGISMFPEDGETHDELIKKADIAMYFVKKMGRNGFQFYSTITT